MISIGKQKFFIVETHLLIKPQMWIKSMRELQRRLKQLKRTQFLESLIPLYYSYDLEDLEVRVCFLCANVQILERYIIHSLRNINGVTATRVRLTLNGEIFPSGFQALMASKKNFCSVHIFIKTNPAHDRMIWENLKKLPSLKNVYPTWIFRDFYEYDRDITLRVIGKATHDVSAYLEHYINNISGILSWKFKIMREFILVQDPSFLTKLAASLLPKSKR